MTTTDVTRANRLELEVLALRAENANLRAQIAAVMEPFEDDSPWSNGRWSGPIGTVVDGPFVGGQIHVAPAGTPLPDGA